ncbi:MAG: hypothetical protein O8C63_11305 [Candidatus Methanoperedens sp.]|nr:hypothetical protein [Candidatus Methanoperedens sp.]
MERIESLEPSARTLMVTHPIRALLGRAVEGSFVNEIRTFELDDAWGVAWKFAQKPAK